MNDLIATLHAAAEALATQGEAASSALMGSTTPPDDERINTHLSAGGVWIITVDNLTQLLRSPNLLRALATFQREHPEAVVIRWLGVTAEGIVAS